MATTAASSPGPTSTTWAPTQAELWQRYEQRLAEAGIDRDAPMKPRPAAGGACASH